MADPFEGFAEIDPAEDPFAAQPSLTQGPKKPLPRINTNAPSPANVAQRALASIKMTPEGRVGFLEDKFGKGNVVTDSDGKIFIRSQDNPKEFAPFDPDTGFFSSDFGGDVADLMGIATQAAPTIVAGSNPVTVGAAGALGSIARQGLSSMLPGDDNMSLVERGVDVGANALLAGGSQQGVNLLAKGVDKFRPTNILAERVIKQAKSPFARQGRQRSASTGIPLTLAEETGSRIGALVEGVGRRTLAAQKFFDFQQKQLQATTARLGTILERVAPGGTSDSFRVGGLVTGAFNKAVDSARNVRKAAAKRDFGQLDETMQGRAIIPPNNLVAEIDDLIQQFDVPGAGDAAQALVSKAKALKDGLIAPLLTGALSKTRQIKELTAAQTGRLLEVYTRVSGGTGLIFKDIEKAQSIMIGKRLKDALLRDLDETADAGGLAGAASEQLQLARNNYRLNSAPINELKDSVLNKVIGTNKNPTPERVAEGVLKLHPSEIKGVMGILEKSDPASAMAVRRFFIEAAITKAVPPVSSQTPQGIKFSATRFLSSLPDTKTLVAAGFDRKARFEIATVASQLARVSDKALEGSPTGPFLLVWDAIKGVFLFPTNPAAVGRGAVTVLGARKIAQLALTPEGRRSLMTITRVKSGTKQAISATANLIRIIGTEDFGEEANVRPIETSTKIEIPAPQAPPPQAPSERPEIAPR